MLYKTIFAYGTWKLDGTKLICTFTKSRHNPVGSKHVRVILKLNESELRVGEPNGKRIWSYERFKTKKTAVSSVWGKAVHGVQARLQTTKSVWRSDETPRFLADVRNTGKLQLSVALAQQLCEIEIDGKTYRWAGTVRVWANPCARGPGTTPTAAH